MNDREQARSRRLERLLGELQDAGAASTDYDDIALLKEIDRARFPRRHERRFPSYGAIVAAGDGQEVSDALDGLGALRLGAPREAARQMRPMADGVQSFAFIRPHAAELVLLVSAVPREAGLIRLRRSLGPTAMLVCRSEDGVVRVIDRGHITNFDGTRWWTKPDAVQYTMSVVQAVPDAPGDITQHILDFCVHTAGPAAGGTILVWCLDDSARQHLHDRSLHTRSRLPVDLPVTLPEAHSALHHLLSQVDGAACVTASGDVVEIGLHLRPSVDVERRVGTQMGTRHASAQQCSHDIPGAVFFVVSDDGPVTVYFRGAVVASIALPSDTNRGAVS